MRHFVPAGLLIAALALPRAAHGDEFRTTDVPAVDPLVVEWLTLEILAPPLGIGVLLGGHKWVSPRLLLGARGAVRQISLTRDLDGDGTVDFARSLDNNPRHFEVQADVAWSFRTITDRVPFGSGLRRATRDASGRQRIRWTHTDAVERIRDVSLAMGVRAAVGGDELQVGLPVGVRWGSRLRTKSKRFREHWLQARAILIPQKPTAGVDAEVVYMPAIYGLSAHFEYFPKIGDTDPAGPSCKFGPSRCDPATPLSSFNRIPDQGMWQLTVRLRIVHLL